MFCKSNQCTEDFKRSAPFEAVLVEDAVATAVATAVCRSCALAAEVACALSAGTHASPPVGTPKRVSVLYHNIVTVYGCGSLLTC